MQTATFAPLLREDGHEVAISAFCGLGGRILDFEGLTVYPSGWDIYGNDIVLNHATDHFGGDLLAGLIVTLIDVWVLSAANMTRANVACWTPVDHYPPPPRVLDFLHAYGGFTIAMSRFGQSALAEQGIEAYYVPHGVNTEVFSPQPRDEARERLGLPQEAFICSMVAANKGYPPRKAFPEVVRAFKRFSETHSDAILHFHTEVNGTIEGVNIPRLLEVEGIPVEKVRFVDQYRYHVGLPPEVVRDVYAASDVLLNPSYSEGFGIPIIEAQACGTPVIANDSTAMPELVGAGWLVEGQDFWSQQGSYIRIPSVDGLVDALEKAYRDGAGMGEQAREFALAYDARRVMAEHWRPVLAEIESEIAVPVAA